MRTLRTCVATTGAAAVLAISAAGTMAQSGPCTGELEFDAEGMNWSATDPRLSGDATGVGGWSFHGPISEDAGASTDEQASYVIINEDGTWSCVDSKPVAPEPDAAGHTMVFTGTGDYEGLTAHVRIDWDTYPATFTGLIVEESPPEDPTLDG